MICCSFSAVCLNLQNADLKKYAATCEEVGANLEVKTLNLFKLFEKSGQYSRLLLEDGVHFSTEGYDLVAEHLLAQLPETKIVMPSSGRKILWNCY